MDIVDTHCHLYDVQFEENRKETIEKALESGVKRILVPGVDIHSSEEAIALADEFPEIFAAVGIHPNSGIIWAEGTSKILEDLAQHPKVVAIGEIGLDYYWDKTPRDIQEPVFLSQLDLAEKLGLPVVIHMRESVEDVIRILLNWQKNMANKNNLLAKRPGVLHSYSGNIKQARNICDANFAIGITGPVTFNKADKLRQLVSEMSLDNILVETDAPYLTPMPHRGKRNEPMYVK
ncbi:MAG: TatD family hydrolase, partial [Chloroflexota bacterium]